MAKANAKGHKTVEDWETELKPQVQSVELLGEIPVTADACARLGNAIGDVVAHLKRVSAFSKIFIESYPAAFAVYLVAEGLHSYKGGKYWPQVLKRTGFSTARTSKIGQTFEQILEDFRLPLFYDMRAEGAQRYVSLILAHGGIPTYYLNTFFANVVQPSVLRAAYVDLSAAEWIEEWRYHAQAQYQTAKPLLRFLTYGGRVAENFLERCREMARAYLDEGAVPDPEEVGLPQRVVSAYDRWVERQDAEEVKRESGDRWRLRKPQVLVDPWGEGVLVHLPPQQVPATKVYATIAWQIATNPEAEPVRVPAYVRRVGFDRKTEEEILPLPQPSAGIEVALLVDGAPKRTWRYQGIDDQRPLLAFDQNRGTLMSWTLSLPAEPMGLLYPTDLELHVEGEGRFIEELPRMPWGWSAFRGETWDLTAATRLVLTRDGDDVITIPLRPAEVTPVLVGGACLSSGDGEGRAAVYVGAPPAIRIPLTGRQQLGRELARWRITVQNAWLAEPEVKRALPLAELQEDLTVAEDHVDLSLGLPDLLGERPCGNYEVRLRGPLGRDAGFTLRMIPHFVLCGQEQLYLPTPKDGPQPATLLAETLPGDRIACQVEDGTCEVRVFEEGADVWEHEIEIGPHVTDTALTLIHPHPSGEMVRVPLHVPIHRLRWALVDEETAARRSVWTGSVIREPVEALYQRQAPALLIKLPLQETAGVRLGLRLLNDKGDPLQVTDRVALTDRRLTMRFDLGGFLDTMRASRSPILRFEMSVWGLPRRDTPLRLPFLSLTRTLIVDNVDLTVQAAEDATTMDLHLTWDEPVRLRDRHVRFWPLWRPWDPVFEKKIPDDREGALTFSVAPDTLRAGKYRLEFLVIDPWTFSDAPPHRPPPDAPSTADLEIVSADEHLKTLDSRLQETADFETYLERSAVYEDIGMAQKARADRTWCYRHLDEGSLPQMLALVNLAREADDTTLRRSLQLKLAAPRRVKQILAKHQRDDLAPDTFEAYLETLPRASMLPRETCEYLVTVKDETTRLGAAQQLIHHSNPTGPRMVVRWVEDAALSDADALALLNRNLDFSAEVLEENPDNPAVMRLLRAMAPALGDKTPIVQRGTWIYTDAGWGRIDHIENLSGEPVKQFLVGQTGYRLTVVLRPAIDAEPMLVDLHTRTLTFTEAKTLYTCGKCNGFITQSHELIVEKHDHVAHSGMGARTKPGKAERTLTKVTYSAQPPPNRGAGVPEEFLPENDDVGY